MWKAYNNLNLYFNAHYTINHSFNVQDSVTGVHRNTIERNWRSIKAPMPLRCRSKMMCELYLFNYICIRNQT